MGWTLIKWGRIFKLRSITNNKGMRMKIYQWCINNNRNGILRLNCFINLLQIFISDTKQMNSHFNHKHFVSTICHFHQVLSEFSLRNEDKKRVKEQGECESANLTKQRKFIWNVSLPNWRDTFHLFRYRCVIDVGCKNRISHWMSLMCI